VSILLHGALILVLCPLVVGLLGRTKALWTGRRGPPLLQLVFDLHRLLRKRAVFSDVTTFVFRLSPYLVLASALTAVAVVPVLGVRAPAAFPLDFVWFAYVAGLGRMALMLGALDTGSSFEGMGASREATFSALIEPTLFAVMGAMCLKTGVSSFGSALLLEARGGGGIVWGASIVALFIGVQVESARMPVDDPTTHLELTMVHEVMILDHSGPELAALQAAAALKLTVALGLVATLLNPLVGRAPTSVVVSANVAMTGLLAVFLGTVESLVARLKLRVVPQYIVVAFAAASAALLATTLRGSAP